jgi:hypothetical protein
MCADGTAGCDSRVLANITNMLASGAIIGTHGENEAQAPSSQNLDASAASVMRYTNSAANVFFVPGGFRLFDSGPAMTISTLVSKGYVAKGEVAFGVHPHFALKIDSATDYDDSARYPIVEIPANAYYARMSSANAYSHVWSHEITAEEPNCYSDAPVGSCMKKAVDLIYGLGGLINLYDHIGELNLAYPTQAQFRAYLCYTAGGTADPYCSGPSKQNIYKTDTLDLVNWYTRRDPVRVARSFVSTSPRSVSLSVTRPTADAGPYSIEVDLPWTSPLSVRVNGVLTTNYQLIGNQIRVPSSAGPTPISIVISNSSP